MSYYLSSQSLQQFLGQKRISLFHNKFGKSRTENLYLIGRFNQEELIAKDWLKNYPKSQRGILNALDESDFMSFSIQMLKETRNQSLFLNILITMVKMLEHSERALKEAEGQSICEYLAEIINGKKNMFDKDVFKVIFRFCIRRVRESSEFSILVSPKNFKELLMSPILNEELSTNLRKNILNSILAHLLEKNNNFLM